MHPGFNQKARDVISLAALIICASLFVSLHIFFRSYDVQNTPMSDYGFNGWSNHAFDAMLFSQAIYFIAFSPNYLLFSKRMFWISIVTALGPVLVAVFPAGNMHLIGVSWLFLGISIQIIYAKYKIDLFANQKYLNQFLNVLFWITITSLAAFLTIELIFSTDSNRGITQRLFIGSSMIWLILFTISIQSALGSRRKHEDTEDSKETSEKS